MRHRTGAALAALGLALALPACGSDDEESSGGGSGEAEAAALEITLSSTAKGKSTLKAPKSVEAGLVELSVRNDGKQPGSMQLIRVTGDQTGAQVDKIFESEGGPIPEFVRAEGGTGTVAPGKTSTVTDRLEPGRYFLADTDGGARGELEVTGEAGDAELPETSASITAKDYGFETSGLKAGGNEITFANSGKELHHVIAAPYNKGATLAQVKKFAMSEEEPSGPPPIDFEKVVGTTVLDGGDSQIANLELAKGKYAFLCFIQDRKGGPPHVAKGMIQEVEIP